MKIIDVRGCFWHQHRDCIDSHIPKTHREYWKPKLKRNQRRDQENQRVLTSLGWKVLVIWECETTDAKSLSKQLARFLRNK